MQDNFVPVLSAPNIMASASFNRMPSPDNAYVYIQMTIMWREELSVAEGASNNQSA